MFTPLQSVMQRGMMRPQMMPQRPQMQMNPQMLMMLRQRIMQQQQQRPQMQQGQPSDLSQALGMANQARGMGNMMQGGLPALGAVGFNFGAPPAVNAITNAVGGMLGQQPGNQRMLSPGQAPGAAIGTIASMFGSNGLFNGGGNTGNMGNMDRYKAATDSFLGNLNSGQPMTLQRAMQLDQQRAQSGLPGSGNFTKTFLQDQQSGMDPRAAMGWSQASDGSWTPPKIGQQ